MIMKMKKLFGALLMSAFCVAPTFAQTENPETVQLPSKFSSNWYIQLQGGVNYTLTPGYKDSKFFKLLSPNVAVSVGKEFTPIFGARVQLTGWESKATYAWKDDQYKHNFIQGNVDLTVNLINIFRPYDIDRVFNLSGFVGLGYVHGYGETLDKIMKTGTSTVEPQNYNVSRTNQIAPRAGLKADFLIADNFSLNVEGAANLLDKKFSGNPQGKHNYEGLFSLMAGITYHFNKRGFDYVDYIDQATVDQLNGQVNLLRSNLNERDSKIALLETELGKKPTEVVKTQEIEEVLMNAVVVFKIGTATLQDNQEINIFNAAKFFQDNPDYNCIVTGYADKATGNARINQELSEKRAQAVANVMIQKFGIPANRIITQASGDKIQPFQNDAWNRVVVFTAVKNK